MSKPIIGILGFGLKTPDDKSAFGTVETYKSAVVDLGGIPIMIMPTQSGNIGDMKATDAPKLSHENYNDSEITIFTEINKIFLIIGSKKEGLTLYKNS